MISFLSYTAEFVEVSSAFINLQSYRNGKTQITLYLYTKSMELHCLYLSFIAYNAKISMISYIKGYTAEFLRADIIALT